MTTQEFIDAIKGMSVLELNELVKACEEEFGVSAAAGVVYKVYKNTFLKRAFEGSDFAQLDSVLEGPTAVAISKDDATAPARILAEAMKGAPALTFKAGVVEGTLYDENGCKVLATIPSKDVLISKLLGSIKSPLSNLARVLSQIAEKQA